MWLSIGISSAQSNLLGGDVAGVVGDSDSYDGVKGFSSAANGVTGMTSAAGATGVTGIDSSTGGIGIYGQSVAGYGIYGTTIGNGQTAVAGVDQSETGGIGVSGNSDLGTAVQGISTKGTAVLAQCPTGTALDVQGVATFSRSGLVSIAATKKTATVTGVALAAPSLVLANLQNTLPGVFVEAVVPNITGHSFEVFLSEAVPAGKTAKVAWFVVN